MDKIVIAFIFSILVAVSNADDINNKAGVHIVLSEKVVSATEKKFLPIVFQQIQDLDIPDQTIDIDIKIGTLHVSLMGIHFHLNNLSADDIQIKFQEPSFINVNANNIAGSGHLDVRFKLGFIKETDHVDVRVTRLNIYATATLGWQESSNYKNKYLPNATLTNLKIDLDFDFDIHGSLIAGIVGLVHSRIKNYIKSQIETELTDKIKTIATEKVAEIVGKLPVYVDIGAADLSVDYSLTQPPKIVSNFLVVSSFGAIVNPKKEETLNPPFPIPTNLPDFDLQGKDIQGFVTDYSINTAFFTTYKTDLLQFTLESSDVPDASPIHLNTKDLDHIVHGLVDLYGNDKNVNLYCKVINNSPSIVLKDNRILGELSAQCELDVIIDESHSDKAVSFDTTIKVTANILVKEEGEIHGEVFELKLNNSQLVDSKIKDVQIQDIERLFNFATEFALPIINQKFLNKIVIKPPTIEGISFNDSSVQIKEEYIELNLNPVFS